MDNLEKVQYTVRESSRAKRMRITVCRDGNVIATVPRNFNLIFLEKFIAEKTVWIKKKVDIFLKAPAWLFKGSSKKDYKKHKADALILINERIEFFNKFYNLKFNRICIKNQKTRWGSCSKRGNLNFNYRIIFLPTEIRDYIVVHELCHLKELNHSRNFWNLVGKMFPDYKQIRKKLKVR